MKKSLIAFALGMVTFLPTQAQWTHYDTQTAISGVFGAINHSIESAERKKQMEISKLSAWLVPTRRHASRWSIRVRI